MNFGLMFDWCLFIGFVFFWNNLIIYFLCLCIGDFFVFNLWFIICFIIICIIFMCFFIIFMCFIMFIFFGIFLFIICMLFCIVCICLFINFFCFLGLVLVFIFDIMVCIFFIWLCIVIIWLWFIIFIIMLLLVFWFLLLWLWEFFENIGKEMIEVIMMVESSVVIECFIRKFLVGWSGFIGSKFWYLFWGWFYIVKIYIVKFFNC